MFKSFLFITISIFLLLLVLGFLRVQLFSNYVLASSIINFVGCFYFTLLFLKLYRNKQSPETTILLILSGLLTVSLYTIYLYLKGGFEQLPLQFIRIFSIISAYAYFRFKSPINLLPFCLSSIFLTFMLFQGWHYWTSFYWFGTFTGKVGEYYLPTKFEAFNEDMKLVTNDYFTNKIVLLDFWTTSCSLCFQKFPHLQTVYDKYQQDTSVVVLAVDTPLEEDTPNQAFEMIKQRNYTFPVVVTKDADLAEKWGVNWYPTTFVINQSGQIVYKGDIEGAIRMVGVIKSAK